MSACVAASPRRLLILLLLLQNRIIAEPAARSTPMSNTSASDESRFATSDVMGTSKLAIPTTPTNRSARTHSDLFTAQDSGAAAAKVRLFGVCACVASARVLSHSIGGIGTRVEYSLRPQVIDL